MTVENEKLVEAIGSKFRTETAAAKKSGVHVSIVSRAIKNRRGLSPEAAESLGDALGLDPTALFVQSQTAAKVAQAASQEISAAEAVRTLSRVLVKLSEIYEAGELVPSPELTEAVELLGAAIREIGEEAGDSVKKFAHTPSARFRGGVQDHANGHQQGPTPFGPARASGPLMDNWTPSMAPGPR